MSSPRYLAAHLILPAFLREQGAPALLAAIERADADFFVPVWMQAGFRFSPRFIHRAFGELRIGVLSLPRPRQETEAFFAAVAARVTDLQPARFFLLELAEPAGEGGGRTMIGEWAVTAHRNFGNGPPFSGDFAADAGAFIEQVKRLCQ
jgi:hypothetical protein